jgi:hypothetical protein
MISKDDKRRFFEEGYLLVENVVPERLCAAVRATICEFLDMRENDPATWPARQSRGHGIVPLHHAQALWNVRQHPAVHRLFADLYGTDALWVSYDRASFKIRDQHGGSGPADPIHWDGHPAQLDRLSIQGLAYLTDTTPDQGAFCCVPSLYREVDAYLAEHPDHGDSRRPEVDPDQIRVVGGPPGSMVLWHRRMPHSSTRNVTDRPRWVQYVAMDPVGDEAARRRRVTEYEQAMPPKWAIVQKVSGQQIPEPAGPAELDELGRKLVGLDRW